MKPQLLMVGRSDKDAHTVPVLREGGVVAVLRAAPPPAERVTADVGDRSWVLLRHGRTVTGSPSDAPAGDPVLRAETTIAEVLWVRLDGRPLQVRRLSWLRGMHAYRDGGREVARSGMAGLFRPITTFSADDSLPLEHQVVLMCLDLYTCRRNTRAGQALGITRYNDVGV